MIRNRQPSARGTSVNDTALSRGRPERFHPTGWWRADVGSVSSWTDKSGNAKHLLQATGSKQPTITASAVNGKPAFLFDGSDDFMQASISLAQPLTYKLVYNLVTKAAAGGHDVLFDTVTGTTSLLEGNDPLIQANWGAALNYFGAIPADNTWAQLSLAANTTASEIRLNRVSAVAGNLGASNPDGVTVASVGAGTAGRCANVAIAELALFARLLSTSEMMRSDNYERAMYGFA